MTSIPTEEFMMTELGPIPCDWEIGMLGSGKYFEILPSGIDNFTGQKKYLSTASIQGWKIESPECLIYYGNRPSRANMQPRPNTVWFAKMIGTVKVCCFTESNREEVTEYILSTGFCGIRCKEGVDTEYLKFIFLSDYFNTVKDSLCSGATQRAINNDGISSIKVAVPPLAEQKKIAYVQSTMQAAIEKTEAVVEATKELKKALMKHLFTYGPVSIDEAGNVPLKETEIGLVPEGWEVVRLGSVSTISTGTTPSTKRADYYCGEISFIKTSEICNNVIDKAVTRISNKAVKDYNLKMYGPNTVFLAMYGQGKTRGQVSLLNIMAATTQNTAAIVPNSKLRAEYLWHYLMSRYEFLRNQGFQGQISHLNLGHVKQILIPLPALGIQEQISDILNSLWRRTEAEENKKKALGALFKTLLGNLMTGRTRVNGLEVPV